MSWIHPGHPISPARRQLDTNDNSTSTSAHYDLRGSPKIPSSAIEAGFHVVRPDARMATTRRISSPIYSRRPTPPPRCLKLPVTTAFVSRHPWCTTIMMFFERFFGSITDLARSSWTGIVSYRLFRIAGGVTSIPARLTSSIVVSIARKFVFFKSTLVGLTTSKGPRDDHDEARLRSGLKVHIPVLRDQQSKAGSPSTNGGKNTAQQLLDRIAEIDFDDACTTPLSPDSHDLWHDTNTYDMNRETNPVSPTASASSCYSSSTECMSPPYTPPRQSIFDIHSSIVIRVSTSVMVLIVVSPTIATARILESQIPPKYPVAAKHRTSASGLVRSESLRQLKGSGSEENLPELLDLRPSITKPP
ncbi:hypothetical protein JAAARDRAFT_54290 [Jaapia argillacea MUCL 33604]|uniref:Uncharacterized protein n=1 Tax=Jaapia argillacea MUCL 33604 TaxID=933084 RepID=A0A067Q5Q2_9AGAM|nr:hypothetical protein JAAARDRAFT_54290 [Jaapia argillacea MUCL 33604]